MRGLEQRIQNALQVTLDASGAGNVRIQSDARQGMRLVINRITVSASSAVLESLAGVYRGNPSPTTLISQTISGSTGDTDDGLNEELQAGEYLTVQWSGGDVGAVATAVYYGKLVPDEL